MTITEVKVNNTMTFLDLEIGNVFEYDKQLYLKIANYDECGELMNCVCFTNYNLSYMEDKDKVILLNAVLTIN